MSDQLAEIHRQLDHVSEELEAAKENGHKDRRALAAQAEDLEKTRTKLADAERQVENLQVWGVGGAGQLRSTAACDRVGIHAHFAAHVAPCPALLSIIAPSWRIRRPP